jgi:hypothetical protein
MENIKTMFEIENKVVSLDIIKEQFCCDTRICKGNCCVQGESGAPLDDDEVLLLDRILPELKKYLRPEGITAIEEQGTSVIDLDGDKVTPLIGHMECAYAVFEDDIARCGIEKAYEAGAIEFRKPISCHLYPIRINKYHNFEAVNYHHWHLCECARKYGNELNIPIYKFVEEALNRKYGKEFTEKLYLVDKEVTQLS